jgi:Putative Actinobacterial Holin-X, holin superfamily III
MDNTGQNHVLRRETADWAQLLSKTVDDLSRIARTEMDLLETKLALMLDAQTDKIAGMVFLVAALTYGALFLSVGVVFLIHQWLAWWVSLLITGGAIIALGIFFQTTMSAIARHKQS